ncbi:MAG TPA: WD40 repeat domain-containing protein [Jatrophihabitans sp.]|nr:WD40 repeat domain-containing protein [Jatrophihabitans sp.]
MIQHRSPVSGIAAFGDSYVLTAGYDNQVILWDQSSKRAIARAQHDHLANQATFSPDGRYALTSSSDYGARLWTVPELRLVAVLAGHDDDVEMSVFHPAEELIATASRDHHVRIWDFGGRLLRTLSGHTADVISVEWVSGADEVLSSSDDGTIRRWSASSGELLETLDMDGVETDTVAISAGGTIFAGNDDGELIVVSPQDGRQTIQAHDAGIKRLVLDDGRGLLVSLSYDRRMRLWDTSGAVPKDLATADLPPDVWPRSCAFAGDSTIVFATFGATYRTYDYRAERWEDAEVPPTYGVNAAVRVPGVGVLAVGDAGIVWRDGAVLGELGSLCNFLTPASGVVFAGGQLGIVFDARTGRRLHQHRSPLNCGVAFERDGAEHVLIGTYTGEGLLFRIEAGGEVRHVGEVPLAGNAVKGVACSGDLLFAVSADAGACWYDRNTLRQVGQVAGAHDKIANGCVGLGAGYFASVSRDLKLRIWNPSRQAEVLDTPHDHSIKCVSASPDGRYVATGGYHGRIAIYDRDSRRWCYEDRPTTAGISSLAFDGEDGTFLASSYDGEVYRAEVRDR